MLMELVCLSRDVYADVDEEDEDDDDEPQRKRRRRKKKGKTKDSAALANDRSAEGNEANTGSEVGPKLEVGTESERLSKNKKRKLKKKRRKEKLRSLGLAPSASAVDFTYQVSSSVFHRYLQHTGNRSLLMPLPNCTLNPYTHCSEIASILICTMAQTDSNLVLIQAS